MSDSTLEENIKQILKPYADAYFNENDASTIAAEFKQHNKWRKEELNNLSAAILSLYQKELETVLNKIAAVDPFYGPRMIELAGFKPTGEQP